MNTALAVGDFEDGRRAPRDAGRATRRVAARLRVRRPVGLPEVPAGRMRIAARNATVAVDGERFAETSDGPAVRFDGFVLPGLTDAHVHFPSWALGLGELELFATRSAEEVVRIVVEGAGGAASGAGAGWLRGRGWRDELWPDGAPAPHRTLLDAVCAERPVALRAHDGHSLWLNSAALALADPAALEVDGGVVERDADGQPTGILREESAWRFLDEHASPTPAERLASMRAALPAAAAAGVVAIHDKDGDRGALELFHALDDDLTLRVWQSLPLATPTISPPPGSALPEATTVSCASVTSRASWTARSARRPRGCSTAPACRSSTATRRRPDPARRGARLSRGRSRDRRPGQSQRPRRVRGYARRVGAARPAPPHRARAVRRAGGRAALRVARRGAASVQYTHATSDRDLAERLWPERIEHAYPYPALLGSGARLAAGSDAPVEPLDPLEGMRAAVDRTTDERPRWRTSRPCATTTALESFTTAPAWLESRARGGGATGHADLVIVDRDPREDSAGVRVVATMAGGQWVHGAGRSRSR